ncbi:MAG TPA: hypothetical protein VIP11_04605 [Gemmatimonadaceae bacterium]
MSTGIATIMIDPDSDPAEIAVRYLRYVQTLRTDDDPDTVWAPETDPDCRAYSFVEQKIRHGPAAVAWPLVRAIFAASPDEDLDTQAAGPLEDLVRTRGVELASAIEAEARRDARFRWALGQIRLSEGELPLDVQQRIVEASGGEIKVFTQTELNAHDEPPPTNVADKDRH